MSRVLSQAHQISNLLLPFLLLSPLPQPPTSTPIPLKQQQQQWQQISNLTYITADVLMGEAG